MDIKISIGASFTPNGMNGATLPGHIQVPPENIQFNSILFCIKSCIIIVTDKGMTMTYYDENLMPENQQDFS
jgi:hypothetical protein